MKKLPELLCPAGSPDALDAAIEGGADAVYLGGALFNARMHAKNFGGDALRSAVLRAHAFGVKVYLTLNTLVGDRELTAFTDAAYEAMQAGVDALIVADMGGAAAIHRLYPSLELHASTQMSGHNAQMGALLQQAGFSRMVIARETPADDIRTIVQNSPIEVEMFIHGALCVSHSGQCLFSSLVGGRSGNRGECAQPCRLPFSCVTCKKNGARESYPLSLKDHSLATHVPELIGLGVASLKIEGRMKAPEYVRDTARIWRRLLDENRAATPQEMRALADAFSRGGFTDGYFTKSIDRSMLGIRSDSDKTQSRTLEPFSGLTRKVALDLDAHIQKERPITLTLSDPSRSVTVCGEPPQIAINAPMDRERVEKSLCKFGGTPYRVNRISITLDDGLMIPVSQLNELRRRAVAAWEAETDKSCLPPAATLTPRRPSGSRPQQRSARFHSPAQITPTAKQYFDRIFLPLQSFSSEANGVVLPPVIFDSERAAVAEMLADAAHRGAQYALVGNLGHIGLAADAGLTLIGDYRLNLCNNESVARAEELGFQTVILSPELTLPQIRDIGGASEVIVYGRIPLMTLEKCVIREISDCNACKTDTVCLRDRRGVAFPVLREWEHRNVIYNSLPTAMTDREPELRRARITARHYLFTVETPQEVDAILRADRSHTPLRGQVRRI